MGALSLSTRIFLASFLVSALLFCGIFFYVKGYHSQREAARAEAHFNTALLRFNDLLQQQNLDRPKVASILASGAEPDKDRILTLLRSIGLVPVLLRTSGIESRELILQPSDTAPLRALGSKRAQLTLAQKSFFAQSLETGPNDSWKVVLLFPLSEFERANKELLDAFLMAGLALLFLSAVFSQLLAREVMRPLSELRDRVRSMAISVGFDPPASRGDEIREMTRSYLNVARHLQESFEHKKLALEELETYKSELLRSNQNLQRRLFQVKVLLSLWSERDSSLDVKDFLSRFLEALLPGLPFEYGCIIIRPLANLSSETIFARKIELAAPSAPTGEEGPDKATQWTDIIDPQVKDFLLRESESCQSSQTFKLGLVDGHIRQGSPATRLTVLTLRLQQGEEPLGSVHLLTEQPNPPIPATLTDFLLSLTAQVAAQLQIQSLSLTTRVDPLTRLYNRGYLNDRLREELVRSARSRQAFSLVMLDIDNFRELNDQHGTQAGDEVLRNVSALLKRCCRGSDAVCRYAGSEIAILLTDTALSGAKTFAENVRKAVEAEVISVSGKNLRVTVSMGVAEHPTHGSGLEELITKAEHALLDAKADGHNRWRAVAS